MKRKVKKRDPHKVSAEKKRANRTVSQLVKSLDRKGNPVKLTVNQRKFLAAYRGCLSMSMAARIAGISNYCGKLWKANDEAFRLAFFEVHKDVSDQLEAEALSRAMDGTRKLVTHMGRPVFVFVNEDGEVVDEEMEEVEGVRKIPLYEESRSDAILLALLKAKLPEVYRDRTDTTINANVQHTAKVVTYLPEKEPDDPGNTTPAIADNS